MLQSYIFSFFYYLFAAYYFSKDIFLPQRQYTPVPGTPTLTCVPFVPVVIFAPRGPMLTLVLFFPKFTRTPGNIFIDFLKNVVISIGLSFTKIVQTEGNEARFNC